MKSKFISQEIAYDGSQLHSLFAYLGHEVLGDSIVSFIGACDVAREHMVDGEDFLAGETIAGHKMLHFIIERFNTNLISAVALQRLFASICMELLRVEVAGAAAAVGARSAESVAQFRRSGDDIYFRDGKMSISIATVSPVSALVHFALNIKNDGTPVKTAALGDVGVKPEAFARKLMDLFASEIASIEEATMKVYWVK